ncbi:MAG TPA: phage tail protein [Rhodospirillales bacterium]
MRKLAALAKYLQQVTGLHRERFTAFADQGTLIPTGRDLGNGIEIGIFKYDAVIQIERYPGDAYHLLAVVSAWLADNDATRDDDGLADPDVDIGLNDDRTADVDLSVEFEERIQIVPQDGGPIAFDGRDWAVVDVPVDFAESVDGMDGEAGE